jgi:Leucine-rich repeat (LRR) protein
VRAIKSCAGVRFLCLRQNLLADSSWLQALQCKSVLEELHLNDNQLTAAPELQGFTALTRLELSYNHEVCVAAHSFANNRFALIEPTRRARLCKNLSHAADGMSCISTERLYVAQRVNRVLPRYRLGAQIRSLQPISKLDALSLQEIYCAVNKVSEIEGLAHLTALTAVELGSNRIKVSSIDRELLTHAYLSSTQSTLHTAEQPKAHTRTARPPCTALQAW